MRDADRIVRRRVVVRGFVQGVGYRYSTAAAARARGIAGWVRNRPDGSVEAVFEGELDAVEGMVRWCEGGPRGAGVTLVEVTDEPPEQLSEFEIRA
jgi:acylphosphatase